MKHHAVRGRGGQLLLLLPLTLALGVGPGTVAEPTCQRLPQALGPVWLPSAAWSDDGQLLVVSDIASGRLLRFSARGERLSDISSPGMGPRDFNHPTWLHPTASGFVLCDRTFRWLALDREARPIRLLGTGDPQEIGMVAGIPTGNEIVGVGSARQASGEIFTGFMKMELGTMAVLAWGDNLEEHGREIDYYYALGRFLALAGGEVYALRFEPSPHLRRLFPPTRLASFPAGFEHVPPVPHGLTGPGRVVDFENFLRQAKLPVGLVGQSQFLFVLTREPEPSGGSRWWLHRISPSRDLLEATLLLPSKAPNLLLAPGPAHWAILELGSAEASGRTTLQNLVLMPTEWLLAQGSPLEQQASPVHCQQTTTSTAPQGDPRRALRGPGSEKNERDEK